MSFVFVIGSLDSRYANLLSVFVKPKSFRRFSTSNIMVKHASQGLPASKRSHEQRRHAAITCSSHSAKCHTGNLEEMQIGRNVSEIEKRIVKSINN